MIVPSTVSGRVTTLNVPSMRSTIRTCATRVSVSGSVISTT